MEKLLAILARSEFDFAEDQGDEEIGLYFNAPPNSGIEGFSVSVELDNLRDLELRRRDGTLVDFTDIYAEYDRDSDGNEIEIEDEDETEEDK